MWILAMFIFGGYNSSSPMALKVEYNTLSACQTAYNLNVTEIRKKELYRVTIVGTCTTK